ncbi:peptide ABC transporter ATP-binding protein [Alkalihalobacillus alcalophilus ATCC 27647 = CGMCC 1.3604]|uniref:Peptide ABC transporter ATP-binding protein n=2 Tax=Alkalihalobacillus alcalophilus ATCC 27647 = CGMCC 1.3604 TaxID=1218173 RepID=A0A094WFP6_ALKAL|nr:ABC transporter ATP-binding protein [Alkalihalobacillus alcalophilus]KGA96604.1 peptide ABC transporter ATP-binding protein [Alkalihalobacillus alcalophilus ATCC 27647 = CGMCC 1.3604]MED1561705.1 ABC transporter ATP-binding protein [Alkalihalobacillus alcalophilus]THG92251.1 peptide ABC transporter ATP-binding protein [Alkalihalobacillus alcalophilus ATCC 27647 = CGMCC 1.3604]
MTMIKNENILEVKNLCTSFFTGDGEVKAVDGVDFSIEKGKTLGIVGESGSGKSITSLSILRLLQEPAGKIKEGEIIFKGENLVHKSKKEMRKIRGNNISMIFQEPMTSLNPTLTCGEQIAESVRIHQKLDHKAAWNKAVDMLKLVGIPSPEKRAKQYPFELSGGMRQRVMIAISLACNPELLIADEPTTALDVTIQAQILELIKNLQSELGTSLMIITHDLGVVAEMCDKVAVMYCGKVVEYAEVETIFTDPKHPYTIGLLNSVPKHDEDVEGDLAIIPGSVPSPFNLPEGCRFAPRCAFAKEMCTKKLPELEELSNGEKVRCWIHTEEWENAGKAVNANG